MKELTFKFKKGSKIHIKPSQKGSFTKYCKGKVTDECILKGKNSPDPKIRKKAVFAQNARSWSHKEGGKAFVKGVNVLDSNPKVYRNKLKVKKAADGTKVDTGTKSGGLFSNPQFKLLLISTGVNLLSSTLQNAFNKGSSLLNAVLEVTDAAYDLSAALLNYKQSAQLYASTKGGEALNIGKLYGVTINRSPMAEKNAARTIETKLTGTDNSEYEAKKKAEQQKINGQAASIGLGLNGVVSLLPLIGQHLMLNKLNKTTTSTNTSSTSSWNPNSYKNGLNKTYTFDLPDMTKMPLTKTNN